MAGGLRVGFVGLGDMGRPIAERIIAAGFPTVLWARRPQSLAPFAAVADDAQIDFATAPDEVAATDVLGVCVFDDSDVRELLLPNAGKTGLLAALRPGSLLVVHSTVSVGTCRDIDEAARARGVSFLDAPVSGGRQAAAAGELAIMVGGESAAYERALPLFRAYGRVIRHMGGVGGGQMMKLLNNLVHIGNAQLAWVALDLGVAMGLQPQPLLDLLRAGTAGSQGLEVLATRMAPDPDFARHVHWTQRKDFELFRALRADEGLMETSLEEFVAARLSRGPVEVTLG